jgi:prevent-host-death family protein
MGADARILHMKTTSLADARANLSRYVEDVVSTHERVTITRNGSPAVVLMSQPSADETGQTVGPDVIRADLKSRPAER